MMKKGGSTFNVTSNDLGIMGMRNNRAQNIDTKFSAAKLQLQPLKAWTISGFGIYSYNKTDLLHKTFTTEPIEMAQRVTENKTDQCVKEQI